MNNCSLLVCVCVCVRKRSVPLLEIIRESLSCNRSPWRREIEQKAVRERWMQDREMVRREERERWRDGEKRREGGMEGREMVRTKGYICFHWNYGVFSLILSWISHANTHTHTQDLEWQATGVLLFIL